MALEDDAVAAADERLVVCAENADQSGNLAAMANPPVGEGPAAREPPKAAAVRACRSIRCRRGERCYCRDRRRRPRGRGRSAVAERDLDVAGVWHV